MAKGPASQNRFRASKRIARHIFLVIVVAAACATWLLARDCQDRADTLEITDFSREPPIDQNNGYLWRLTVSVQNKGRNSVSNATLVMKLLGNDEAELAKTTRPLSTLEPGEQQTIRSGLYLQHGTVVDKTPFSYLATIKLDNHVLDEERVP